MKAVNSVSHFFKNTLVAAGCSTLMLLGALNASAAPVIGFQVEGGGTAQWHQLGNGNVLSLWGFDNREGANPGVGSVQINTAADIIGGFTSNGGSIVGFYNGTNPVNAGASEFDPLVFGFTIADNARLFDSVWVESTGGTLVYTQPSGGTATFGFPDAGLRQGDPLGTDIPVPAPLGLLGLGAAVLAANRKRLSSAR